MAATPPPPPPPAYSEAADARLKEETAIIMMELASQRGAVNDTTKLARAKTRLQSVRLSSPCRGLPRLSAQEIKRLLREAS